MSLEILYKNITPLRMEEKKIISKLENLYRIEEGILYVKPCIGEKRVDLLLIDRRRGVGVFNIFPWKKEEILYMNQTVGVVNGEGVKNPIFHGKQILGFLSGIFHGDGTLLNEEGELKFSLKIFNLYPYLEKNDIHFSGDSSKFTDILSLPREDIEKIDISSPFTTNKITLLPEEIQCLRGALFPEIRIPNRPKNGEIPGGSLVDEMIKVLDIEQEKIAQNLEEGIHVIRGVPGSGKTVILISRAIYLAKISPHLKIKIITYTRSLKSIIENKLRTLRIPLEFQGVSLDNLSVDTFHGMALKISGIRNNLEENLNDEFWKVELPKIALSRAKETFDIMLIDEYQDFQDSWLLLCLHLIKKDINGKKNLFLAGDPLQSIYHEKGNDLKTLELSFDSNQLLLKHSYRTGKKQMETVLGFLERDPNLKKEIEESYLGKDDIKTQNIHNSGISFIENGYREGIEILKNLIFEKEYNPEEILVLLPKLGSCDRFFQFLPRELQDRCTVSKNIRENLFPITTYHSAKGIEAKICILLDFDQLENKKLAYVGITRASEHVFIHSDDYLSQNFATELYKNLKEEVN